MYVCMHAAFIVGAVEIHASVWCNMSKVNYILMLTYTVQLVAESRVSGTDGYTVSQVGCCTKKLKTKARQRQVDEDENCR